MPNVVTLKSATAEGAGTVNTPVSTSYLDPGVPARVQLDVTAVGGSPTLDVTIEDTVDGTNWNTVGTFAQKTGVAREVINLAGTHSGDLRVKAVVAGTGTPTATYTVKAVLQYHRSV